MQIRNALVKAGGEALATRVYDIKVQNGSTVLTRIHHRQTPLWLMQGKVQAGVTWRSEALFQEQAGNRIAHVEIPAAQNVIAVYSAAMAASAPHPEAARAWLDFIHSDEAFAILETYGFKRNVPLIHWPTAVVAAPSGRGGHLGRRSLFGCAGLGLAAAALRPGEASAKAKEVFPRLLEDITIQQVPDAPIWYALGHYGVPDEPKRRPHLERRLCGDRRRRGGVRLRSARRRLAMRCSAKSARSPASL